MTHVPLFFIVSWTGTNSCRCLCHSSRYVLSHTAVLLYGENFTLHWHHPLCLIVFLTESNWCTKSSMAFSNGCCRASTGWCINMAPNLALHKTCWLPALITWLHIDFMACQRVIVIHGSNKCCINGFLVCDPNATWRCPWIRSVTLSEVYSCHYLR